LIITLQPQTTRPGGPAWALWRLQPDIEFRQPDLEAKGAVMKSLRCVAIVVLAAYFLVPATAIAQQELPRPRLWSVYPPGAQVGETTEIKIADSSDLYGADKLVFSHPGITAKQVMLPADRFYPQAHAARDLFNVTVAASTPEGIYEVRATGPFGVSNSRRFVVSRHPFHHEEEDNNTAEKANPLPQDVYLAGIFRADYDYFRLEVQAGETLVIDCLGQRIDSRGDPVLSLLDAKGRELQRSHDVAHLDPRIVYQFQRAGEYFVRLNELTHTADGGSGVAPYLLRVSKSPVVAYIEPPFAQGGGARKFTLYGYNLGGQPAGIPTEDGAPLQKLNVTINLPARPRGVVTDYSHLTTAMELKHEFFTYRHKSAAGFSNPVRIAMLNAAPQIEQEPNNELETSTRITLPAVIAGKFDSASDRDSYTFQAKKDDELWIEVDSQRLGQPTDAILVVQQLKQDKEGKWTSRDLKTFDDVTSPTGNFRLQLASTDPAAAFTAPEDGDYRVLVRDQFNGAPSGQACYYQLTVRKPEPDFRLMAAGSLQLGQNGNNNAALSPRACVLAPGGAVEVLVVAHRLDGFTGEIEVQAGRLPAGVTAAPAIIGPEETMTAIVLHAAPNAAPFTGNIEVSGKAVIAGATRTSQAKPFEIIWDARGNTPSDARLTESLMLRVCPSVKPAGRIEATGNKVWQTARGGKLEIPVKLNKLRDDYSGNASAFVLGMPRVIAAPNVSIPVGGSGVVKIDVNSTTPAGRYTFHLRADAQVDHTRLEDYFKGIEEDRTRIIKTVTDVSKEASAATQKRSALDRELQTAANARATAERNQKTAARNEQTAEQALKLAQIQQKKLKSELTGASKATAKARQALAAAKDDNRDKATAELAQKTQAESQKKSAVENGAKLLKTAEAALQQASKELETKSAELAASIAKQNQLKQERADAVIAEQDAAKLKTAGDALRREIDTHYNQIRNAAQKRKVKAFVYSSLVTLDIAEFPAVVTIPKLDFTLQAGGDKPPVEVRVKRDFGFEGDVTFRLEPPKGVSGLQLSSNAKISKGQESGKFELSAAKYTKPGEYEATILCQMRFNNRTLDDRRTIRLTIKPPPPSK